MKKQKQLLIDTESSYQIKLTQQKDDIQQMFSQFKQDFQNSTLPINQSKNFLTPTHRTERRPSIFKSKQKKTMNLMDYIYIRNTVRKNQQLKKSNNGMSATELRKSRMKEGKQKAFKTIVDQMIKELKQLSIKASAISQLVQDNVVYTGNIDQIAKMCNARRILHENIFGSITQIQKLIGIENIQLQAKQQSIAFQKQQRQTDTQLKIFEEMGVRRLSSQPDLYEMKAIKKNSVKQTYSNKDTWVTEKDTQRQEP